jgi:hypothetical protein
MSPSIGFDFDNCLVEAYSLVPFILLFEILIPRALKQPGHSKNAKFFIEKGRIAFYNHIAENEVKTKGTLFRPSLLKLLPRLLKLRKEGKIERMFIYSNNGYKSVIEIIDYILGIVLQKSPYNVKEEELNKEEGVNHVLSPRIYLDEACRAQIEPKGADSFREKSIQGIKSCIGEIDENDLWFLDDQQYHTNLMNSLRERYVLVKEYTIKLANKRVCEMFIDSFPLESFLPDSPIATVLLTQLNKLMPGFRPSYTETRKNMLEKLGKVVNAFSPYSKGRVAGPWKEDDVNADLKTLETKLSYILNQSDIFEPSVPVEYKAPVGGGRHTGSLPVSSRRRKTRKLLSDRRNRE